MSARARVRCKTCYNCKNLPPAWICISPKKRKRLGRRNISQWRKCFYYIPRPGKIQVSNYMSITGQDIADIKRRVLALEHRIDFDLYLIVKWVFEYIENQLLLDGMEKRK